MPAPVTQAYHQLVLEVETAVAGTYAKICGIMGFTVSRELTIDTAEVPADCVDESLPYDTIKEPRSRTFSVEGTATWAQQSHKTMMDWFYGGARKNVRIRHVNAAVGDTEYEAGPAFLTSLSDAREKGKPVERSIKIEFDGTPTRTAKV